MTTHEHTCRVCGKSWMCHDPDWGHLPKEKCGITIAAKSNGEGPICTPCLRIEMKRRYNRLASQRR